AGESNINLSSSEYSLIIHNSSLVTEVSGIHRLVYGIYTGDLLLVSGSEAFDVGDAVLLSISTDKTDYPTNTEPINVKVNMYGAVDANLELQLDGTTVKTQSVSLNGFVTLDIELGTVKPGVHTLKGILRASGLRSTKETNFVYGSSLPDFTTAVRSQDGIRKDNTTQIIATVINQGKTSSASTTIALYDGNSLIEAKTINALNSGESREINFIWNVLGKAGGHTIKAIVDPEDKVVEFKEDNNVATLNITIPDIAMDIATEKETYGIGNKINIVTTLTNLTSQTTYSNLILETKVIDSTGANVFSEQKSVPVLQPMNSTTLNTVWDTRGLTEGSYTITQTVISDSQSITQHSKLITLEKAPGFEITMDTTYQRIKQGESAKYIAHIEPLDGFNSTVNLSISGLPSGTSVLFEPGSLIPPGEATTVIITTEGTPAGSHNLTLIAEGGEVRHEIALVLDVSGFGLEAVPTSQTIKQLETAIFDININSLNDYQGEVNLSIDGVPFGVRASFDNTKSQVPGNVKLTVLTSKYLRPGTYTLTVTGDDGLVKHTLNLNLNLNPNPEIAAGIITTQGPGPNNKALVRAFNSDIQPVLDLMAFDTKYGANATGADIDGDGYDEIIVSKGPDPKNTATLRAFKRNGTTMAEYTAFDTKYGLTLSSGDLDGDWVDELIVGMGPDPKNPAQLKILKYSSNGFTEITTHTAYADLEYGLNTATGDIDGDGKPEIITAPGPGPNNPAIVKVWRYDSGSLTELSTITAFGGNYGANIATGDIDGDGKVEIIVGTGPDPKNPATVRVYKADGALIIEFRPYDAQYGYGVTVSSADIDGDGIAEIITGLGFGPQNPSWVKVFKADGTELKSFLSYPEDIKYGVKVSAGNTGK
ncbi:MAG: VCBS repeat-containing protein, partial [Nitrospirae bacterium]|nr:VCBS repeat-containing protein [Nitrospirota bacterium]